MIKKIRNLFGKKGKAADIQEASSEIPTIPVDTIRSERKELPVQVPAHSELPQLIVGCAQSIGMVRDHNEDSILVMSSLSGNNGDYLPIGLFIVADGMGGHKYGEIASDIAIRTVASEILHRIVFGMVDPHSSAPEDGIQEILETSVLEAHKIITKEAPGSGTTLTAALIIGKQMSIAHIGDSRAYAIHPGGETEILTRDHSLVKRMIELGHLTEEEASVHPQRNVLYRALGQGEPFKPDITTEQIPAPGYLLLCSDGLWGQVSQEEMVKMVLENPAPEIACQVLVNAANRAGGPDNISAILVKLPDNLL
jgi:serine/threonine protein phosphatase PrpC